MEPYKSKDFIIDGSYLLLDKIKSWEMIDKRMRTAVRRAASYNPRIVEVDGSKEDIKKFAVFCPGAETLPPKIGENQKMFFAYINDELVGGLILTEIANNLFLQFNAVTESGREKQISSFLIWDMVERFTDSKYKYLDIGTSYRENLQKYFTGWQTKKYPILMKPPDIKPQLNITPFENKFLDVNGGGNPLLLDERLKNKWPGKEHTFFPRGTWAIYALIKWFALEGMLSQGDEVCIKTTSGSKYISRCVTSAIELTCKWSQEINEKTKAIFVIHEFGFPHPKISEFRHICNQKGIPLIEDCAYLWESGEAGNYGDYLIYSLSKVFPVQFGGILAGRKFEPEYIWNNFACYDQKKEEIFKKHLACHLAESNHIEAKRKRVFNYQYLEDVFGKERSFFNLEDGVVPGAYVLKVENPNRMQEISAYVRQFGIECGNYWHNDAIFLPVHQNLEIPQLDYIIGAVLAMFRGGCGVYNLPC